METNGYDVIVLGAGIVGSSTAYHLQQDGCKVLLLEQVSIELCDYRNLHA